METARDCRKEITTVPSPRIVVIGAGVAGLVTALTLASKGLGVIVIEKAAAPGGKMRQVRISGRAIDAGPTVFTMRWVFDEIFANASSLLDDHVKLSQVDVLARHAWPDGSRLDLSSDLDQAVDAIASFSGSSEAKRYRAFCVRSQRIFKTLDQNFIRAPRPSLLSLIRNSPMRDLWLIEPFTTLWSALGRYFHDPRLRQLFGRYATYCGSSPFQSTATLMLVAHVEREGVWLVEGGMHQLAAAMAALAARRGAEFRYDTEAAEVVFEQGRATGVVLTNGERIDAKAVVSTADTAAVAAGRFGAEVSKAVPAVPYAKRSLSAVTWNLLAEPTGFPLLRHSVFFSNDYRAEFNDIFRHQKTPADPTVYVCAQDRADDDEPSPVGAERLLCLINAPPTGDIRPFDKTEIEQCTIKMLDTLKTCGLTLTTQPEAVVTTTPVDFNRFFPGTGGALYGRASHGWTASFRRPGCRSRIPQFYVAGGSAHPGPGVPMAALSGRSAALSVIEDLGST
jgi:1-hydroxycarotenoid 3,4-desaturase